MTILYHTNDIVNSFLLNLKKIFILFASYVKREEEKSKNHLYNVTNIFFTIAKGC